MKVLVLGANGFVGSNLCARLAQRKGYSVTALDLGSSRIDALRDCPNFNFVKADIMGPFGELDALVQDADVVIPLAAIANPARYIREPLTVFELNFESNLRIIRACVRHNRRLIFPSTSEVYGLSPDTEFSEETTNFVYGPLKKQRWIYASSKHLLERIIQAYGTEAGLQYTIFRPFNWFGPGLDDDADIAAEDQRVTASFIRRAMSFQNLTIIDGGPQKRAFLYIDDAIDALLRIIEVGNNNVDGQVFNIGHPGNLICIRDLATLIISILAARPGYENVASRVQLHDVASAAYFGDQHQEIAYRMPSVSAIEAALGWRPKTTLRAGLEKTIDAYVERSAACSKAH